MVRRELIPSITLMLTLTTGPALAGRIPLTGEVRFSDAPQVHSARAELLPLLDAHASGRLRLEGRLHPEPDATAPSDETGRFVLQAPTSGMGRLLIRAPGFVPMQLDPLLVLDPTELPPVTLLPAVEAIFEIRTSGWAPVADAWVYARSATRRVWRETAINGWRTAYRIGRTNSEGRITLSRAREETLDLTVFPPASLGHTWPAVTGGTLRLPPGPTAIRHVEVRNAHAEPLENILVRTGDLGWPIGLTDPEGRLSLADGTGEELRIWLFDPHGRRQTAHLPATRVSSTEPVVVTFEDSVRVRGRILDATNGRPLAGAVVWPSYEPGAWVRTDARGEYEVFAPGDRPFWLQAEAPGRLPQAQRLTRSHLEARRTPTLALRPTAALAGRVIDAKGAPVADASLEALSRSAGKRIFHLDRAADRTVSDAEGRFHLRRLDPAAGYVLAATREGYSTATVEIDDLAAVQLRSGVTITLARPRAAAGLVLDTGERAVPGAEVRLSAATATDPLETTTDEQGRFELPDVPASQVDLAVAKKGFAPVIVRGIEIPQGEGPVDLGTVILERGVTVEGQVTDADGQSLTESAVYLANRPARSALVTAFRIPRQPPAAVTGADGRFVIEDRKEGERLNLVVHHPGYLPAAVERLEVPPQIPVIVTLKPAAAVAGRVMDEERRSVAGAGIEFEWQGREGDPEGDLWFTVGSGGSTVSDDDGHFRLDGLAPGTAEIGVSAEGFQSITVAGLELVPGKILDELTVMLKRGAVLEGRVVTADDRPVVGARVRAGSGALSDAEGWYRATGLAPGPQEIDAIHPEYGRLAQTITIEPGVNTLDLIYDSGHEVSGSVVDEDDRPVALARIALESDTGAWRVVQGTSGEDGSFRLAPVSDGEYTLRAEQEGYATTELKGAVRVDGRSIEDLEVRLRRGTTIRGRILGLDFDELARVEIRAEADEGREQHGRVNYDGSFEIADLPPGPWRVRASFPEGSREAAVRVVLEPGIREVTRDLEFGTDLAFSGQVLYDEEPLTGAGVTLTGHDVTAHRSVATDYQGRFEIHDLEPGHYRLQVSSGRHGMTHSEDLELAHDLAKRIEIASARLRGRVVEAESGEPIPEALILLRRLAGGGASDAAFLVTVAADADGAFDIPRVTPGRYSLTARKDGYAADERILRIEPGIPLDDLDLALAATAGLELDVRLASGERPRFVTASVLDPADREVTFQSRPLDDDGLARFPTIPPGTWTLLISAPGGATTEVIASVPGEPIAAVLPPAVRLWVQVPELVTSDAVATLTLTDSGGRIFRGNTSEAGNRRHWPVAGGRATVPSLSPGFWTLAVATPDGRAWQGSVVSTAGAELRVSCAAGECHAVTPLYAAEPE